MEQLNEIRKHRFQLENWKDIYNDTGYGISFFDLAMIIFGFIFLDFVFGASYYIPFCRKNRLAYYLLAIPFVVLVSHVAAHIISFSKGNKTLIPDELTYLNQKIFSVDLNFYHVIVFLLLYWSYQTCKSKSYYY